MVSTTETAARGRRRRGRRRKSGGRSSRPPARDFGDYARGTVRLFGEVLFTAGVVMLFFAAYQIYGKQFETNREQEQLVQAMQEQWGGAQAEADTVGADEEDADGSEGSGDEAEALPGGAHSRMYIPDLGQDWVVVSGVTQADIEFGPGHYPGSAEPGELGNYSVAGHRVPAVFWDLDQLVGGDEIVLEDADGFYTYEVTENHIVTPDRVEVVDPNPYEPGSEPERALLTLTTCHPKFNNTHRLIVHAELVEEHDKDEGAPASIASMV